MTNPKVHPGDGGTTGFQAKERISKYDLRIETLGELDEVSSILGVIRSVLADKKLIASIREIQDDLRLMMGEIATPVETIKSEARFDSHRIEKLELAIAELEKSTPAQDHFVSPGDNFTSAILDLGRVMIRRAERRVVQTADAGIFHNPEIMKYINRLSTLFFWLEVGMANTGSHPA